MKIDRQAVAVVPMAVQVATILGVPPETVRVTSGPEGVEVDIGRLTKQGFEVTGDVPTNRRAQVRAWAEALMEEG